ncbi:MAG: RNA polymerase sigma factor [Actinomycetota bacterium]
MSTAQEAVAAAFRQEWGRVLATLIGFTRDWDLAEECVQDAFERALQRWPDEGIPRNPGAWLTTTARNRALDRMRRSSVEVVKVREAATMAQPGDPEVDESAIADDRLRLIFTCCHPALALEARVALTLRTVAGLTTEEIARAFLTPSSTMGQRLFRAKRKIRDAGIPYRVPPAELLPERTSGVLGVLYLLFNEGYAASSGDGLLRPDLCAEAIRLGRILAELMPGQDEVRGVLALMLLQDARRAARTDEGGVLVTLEQQDRTLWDQDQIAEGAGFLAQAPHGPYQLQAAIAACHDSAAQAWDTDWPRIASLYTQLATLTPTPFVALNHAVAVAMADGPAVGLPLVDAIDVSGALAGYHLLPATQADLLRRLGRRADAAAAYERAFALAPTEAERLFLRRRIVEMTGAAPPPI